MRNRTLNWYLNWYLKEKWFWYFQARNNSLKGLFSNNENCMTAFQYKVWRVVNKIANIK